MPKYVMVEAQEGKPVAGAYSPYGALRDLWYCKDPEVMVAGPYETGKTFGCLQKLNALLWKYPKARGLMVRKSYKTLIPSALASYYNKVQPYPPGHPRCPVEVYGGGKPDWINYPNGSQLILGGLDIPEKVLSSEYDFIFVPQAEELSLHDWEQLGSRCTGRAGNAPYSQMIGDCNPDVPTHWILNRERLTVLHSRHTDNPTLFERDEHGELILDEDGKPTPTKQGRRTIETLQNLTGVRYKRGYLGMWVAAEGQVYEEFDATVHVVDNFEIPPTWRRYRAFDFGYTHPFTCQWWAEDHDGSLYLYREIYYSNRTVRDHVEGTPERKGVKAWSEGEEYVANICDWDAEDKATLEEHGIKTTNADKRMTVGIEKVQERLKIRKNGKPRLYIFRDSLVEEDERLALRYQPTSTVEEFPGYVWRDLGEGREQTSKDETPIRTADHGMDALRYMVMYLDGGMNWGKPQVAKYA